MFADQMQRAHSNQRAAFFQQRQCGIPHLIIAVRNDALLEVGEGLAADACLFGERKMEWNSAQSGMLKFPTWGVKCLISLAIIMKLAPVNRFAFFRR